MNRRVLAVSLALFAAACASAPKPATPPPQASASASGGAVYSGEPGPAPVGVIPEGMLHDGGRGKDVLLSIDYPAKYGTFPVIVFSHGYGGSKNGYESLASYWASNGYVVIRPSHADAGALKKLRDAKDIWENQGPKEWRDRADDVAFVLNSFDELEKKYPELKGKLDHARIGVGGHSYGAFTAMLLGGLHPTATPPVDVRDPRVKAVIAMSPQGVGNEPPLTAESFRDLKIPMMFMTGSQDKGVEGQDPAWRKTAFASAPAGDKYYVEIEGARHLSFAGRGADLEEPRGVERNPDRGGYYPPGSNPGTTGVYGQPRGRGTGGNLFEKERHVTNTIKAASLAFWDAYLLDKPAAKEYLQGQRLQDLVTGGVVERK